jgi:hypothetical protein
MSIHAQLSPEAQAALAAQKRNSTISALIISILAFGLVILVLMVIALTVNIKSPPEIISYASGVSEEEEIDKPEMTQQVERKPSAPSSSMAKVIASSSASPTAVPVPDIEITEVALDFGNGNDFGEGWGEGDGEGFGGGGFGNLPSSMKKRCSVADRLQRLKENGGNKKCEDAVVDALLWLQDNQEEDGSWSHEAGSDKYRAAMTGFALLAYLGHCESPNSPVFGETVEKAIIYLVNIGMQNDGKLTTPGAGGHWVYEHAIVTYALAEAFTFCEGLGENIPNLDKIAKKAGDIVMDGQGNAGSWAYSYGKGGGDNSVGYWQIQAIKACQLTQLWSGDSKFKKVYTKAEEWFSKVQGANGTFGYRANPAQNPGLTGGGVLCLQVMGLGNSKSAKAGIDYVTESLDGHKFSLSHLYYHYYNAQAMINHGGKEWKKYNKFFRDDLLDLQNKDGSWPTGGGHGAINPVMTTCLCTFMLEVYYRFLPSSAK